MNRKQPVIDCAGCNLCGGCVEMCPEVFQFNEIFDRVEVADLKQYPRNLVDEAINNCPLDCINWEE